jgi:membrane protein implicated in regulation of membrane protease activity
MIATDPLSLVFLACAVFSGAFLAITAVLGQAGSGHAGHLHIGHIGHVGHVGHVGHIGHVGHVGHAGAHASHAQSAAHGQSGPQNEAPAAAHVGALDTIITTLEGALSVYGVLTFLLVFGLLGYLLHNSSNLPDVLSLLLAIFIALICAVFVSALLTRIFLAQDGGGELTLENSRLEGRLGEVSMTIRGAGIGEVIYTGQAGGRQSIGARSAGGDTIPAGTEIVILGSRDGIARVQPWDDFMASVRAGNAPMLEPIEGQV